MDDSSPHQDVQILIPVTWKYIIYMVNEIPNMSKNFEMCRTSWINPVGPMQ